MIANDFHNILTNKTAIGNADVEQNLLQEIKANPYFSSAYFLLLKHYKMVQSDKYKDFLKLSSIYATDRAGLYQFINDSKDITETFIEPVVDAPLVIDETSISSAIDHETLTSDLELEALVGSDFTLDHEPVSHDLSHKKPDQPSLEEITQEIEVKSKIQEDLDKRSNLDEIIEGLEDETAEMKDGIGEVESFDNLSGQMHKKFKSKDAELEEINIGIVEPANPSLEEIAEEIELKSAIQEDFEMRQAIESVEDLVLSTEVDPIIDINEVESYNHLTDELDKQLGDIKPISSSHGIDEMAIERPKVLENDSVVENQSSFIEAAQAPTSVEESISGDITAEEEIDTIFNQHAPQDSSASTTLEQAIEVQLPSGSHSLVGWLQALNEKIKREKDIAALENLYIEYSSKNLVDPGESLISEPVITNEKITIKDIDEEKIISMARESVSEEKLPASETLAKVYEQQKRFKQAVKIYEKLQLKYPEKFTYFAAKISELQNKNNFS